MKKLTLLVAMICVATTLSAQASFSISPMYSFLHTVEEPITITGSTLSTSWKKQLNQLFNESRNQNISAAGIGIDIHGKIVYTTLSLVFPFSASYQSSKPSWFNKVDTSHLFFDSQLGLGYNFGSKKKVQFYLGGGLALQVQHKKSSIDLIAGKLDIKSLDLMLGLGLNMLLHWYFSNHVGLTVGVSEVYYFKSLKFDRTFKALGGSLSITNQDKSIPKLSPASINHLNLKLGLAFRL